MRSGLLATIGIATLLLAGCGGPPGSAAGGGPPGSAAAGSGEGAPERRPLAVEAAEVVSEPLLRTVRGSGIVRGSREATVVSETEGVLESVDIRLGGFLEEGAQIASLDATVQRLNFEQAEQELERARIELNAIERRAESGSASAAELTRVRSGVAGARSRVEQTRELLENRTITAPIAGYVSSLADDVTPGNYLRRGVAVARLVDLRRLEVEIAVGEREVRFLEVGAPAEVSIPSCDVGVIEATVDAIAAGSDPGTGSFPVIIAWDNECDDIRSGVSAGVEVTPTNQRERLVVPASAILSDGGDHVFLSEEGRAVRRDVVVDERLGNRAAVSEGVAPGEVVLISGLTVLADGDPVTVTMRGRE